MKLFHTMSNIQTYKTRVSRNFAFSARKTFNLRFPEQFLVNTASQAICLKMVKYCLSGGGTEVSLGNLFENYKNGKIVSLWW